VQDNQSIRSGNKPTTDLQNICFSQENFPDQKREYLAMANEHTGFALFTSLPLELRLKIWEHTLQPRIVEIFIKGHLLRSEGGASAEDNHGSELC
jgi:2EXR family